MFSKTRFAHAKYVYVHIYIFIYVKYTHLHSTIFISKTRFAFQKCATRFTCWKHVSPFLKSTCVRVLWHEQFSIQRYANFSAPPIPSIFMWICIYLNMCMYTYTRVSNVASMSGPLRQFPRKSHARVSVSVCLSICLSVWLSVNVSVYVSVCLSVSLSVSISMCLYVCNMSVCICVWVVCSFCTNTLWTFVCMHTPLGPVRIFVYIIYMYPG